MSAKDFNLADVLKGSDLAPTGAPSGAPVIELVPWVKIASDERNFYSMDGIDELAANIETVGLLDPIVIRRDGVCERIVSGHRRCAAIRKIIDGGSEMFAAGIPCIRLEDAGSAAMQELRLIYANSNTRKLSDADLAKQAERINELLYQLREEGVEFPEKMRKVVAEACQVSETKIATLKVIKENLQQPFQAQWERGDLSTAAAYAIARVPLEVQQDLGAAVPKRALTKQQAELVLEHHQVCYQAEMRCPDGEMLCDNERGRLKVAAAAEYSWHYCDGDCCVKCRKTLGGERCIGQCAAAKKIVEAAKEKAAQRKADHEAESQKEQEKLKKKISASAKRLLRAVDAAGLADKEKLTIRNYSQRTVKELRDWARGEFGDKYFYNNEAEINFVSGAVELAKCLGCSTDYLLGLTDDLTPAVPKSDAAPAAWGTGEPPESGKYAVAMGAGLAGVYDVLTWNGKRWLGGLADDEISAWVKLPPEGKEKRR